MTSGGEKMIAHVLARGDKLPTKIAQNIIGDLAGEIVGGLAVERLVDLLNSPSATARAIGVHTAFMCGPCARPILPEIRRLLQDEDQRVKLWAGHCVAQLERLL
jgi:hypothetical protein